MSIQNKSTDLVFVGKLLTATLLLAALFALVPMANGEEICRIDQQGANDEPGQKDLTKVCIDDANTPTSIDVSWNWDEIDWSGNNTGDACLLFDTDGDGNVNTAGCVVVNGSPASIIGYQFYTCNDSRPDRCAGKQETTPVEGSISTCSVAVQPDDPFPDGDEFPNDTVATCTIDLRDVGGETAVPVDVCSYPSGEPNSDPSDCVLQPADPNAITLAGNMEAGTAGVDSVGPLAAAAVLAGLTAVVLQTRKQQVNS